MAGPTEPHFGVNEQKRLIGYKTGNEALESPFPKPFRNPERFSHVYAICCWQELDDDVIFGWDARTIEGYIVENFEVASSSSLRDFLKQLFCDDKVWDGSGGVNAICSQPEIADDDISGEDAETFQENVHINLCVATFSSFRENWSQPFM